MVGLELIPGYLIREYCLITGKTLFAFVETTEDYAIIILRILILKILHYISADHPLTYALCKSFFMKVSKLPVSPELAS